MTDRTEAWKRLRLLLGMPKNTRRADLLVAACERIEDLVIALMENKEVRSDD